MLRIQKQFFWRIIYFKSFKKKENWWKCICWWGESYGYESAGTSTGVIRFNSDNSENINLNTQNDGISSDSGSGLSGSTEGIFSIPIQTTTGEEQSDTGSEIENNIEVGTVNFDLIIVEYPPTDTDQDTISDLMTIQIYESDSDG